MITEDYVSYEVAKLLKEKGFDGQTHGNMSEIPCVSYITHQMAMKWLRGLHNKHCDVGYDIDLKWFFQIIDLKETVTYDYLETKYYHTENETGFNSYEEAVEAALKYCLTELI